MPDDFDDRVLNLLSKVAAGDAEECLSKLESALRIPGSVRNPSAYLAGVVKRVSGPGGPGGGNYAGGGGGSYAGGGGSSYAGGGGGGPPRGSLMAGQGAAPQGSTPQLAPAAARELEGLCADGRLRPADIEGRNLASLAALAPEAQLFVMRSFADRNLAGIRNMAGQHPPCPAACVCVAAPAANSRLCRSLCVAAVSLCICTCLALSRPSFHAHAPPHAHASPLLGTVPLALLCPAPLLCHLELTKEGCARCLVAG